MDFTYSEEQEAVRELAGRIFRERATHERLREIEAAGGDGGPIDRDLWTELGHAGLLGIHLDEEFGGAGLDFVAACLVIEAAGRTAAYVPVVETMVYGALPIAMFGTEAQRKTWLPGAAGGETILTAALAELAGEVILAGGVAPATTASRQADGSWLISGTKACVPAGLLAGTILIPATCTADDGSSTGVGVFIVDCDAEGLTRTSQNPTTGRTEALVELAGVSVPADRLLGGDEADGAAIVIAVTEFATTALCVMEAGACATALELTAEFTKTRIQFEKPIATFQAVGQRAADAWTPRRSASPRGRRRRGWRPGCRPRPRWPWPSSGPPTAGSGSCTRPPTCTGASGWTATTRYTATSC